MKDNFRVSGLLLIAIAAGFAFAATAPVIAQAQQSSREVVAVGGVVTPALEGGGPWLLAGARANTRLSERFGLSVEGNRIWGSKNQFAESTQSYTVWRCDLNPTRRSRSATDGAN